VTGLQTVTAAEIARDRFGRPLIIQPDGGTVPYTRCTTFVGALEDRYNLGRWEQRMVARGLTVRTDLHLQAASLGPEPAKIIRRDDGAWTDNPDYRPWVNAMNDICDGARDAAAAQARATIGTSLHKFAERLDRGEDDIQVPDDYLPHLAAYSETTAGWRWLHIERFLVNDPLKIGGTPDRVCYVPGHDRPVIADLKTGDVSFGVGKMAMQLAVYAHSEIYDPNTGERFGLPDDLDKDVGLIIALDAIKGTCEVLRIDIAAGWVAVKLAAQVRAWRSHRGLTEPWRPALPPWAGRDPLDADTNRLLIGAIQTAATVEQLTSIYRSVARGAWLDVHTQHAARRKRQLLGDPAA
jgi:hypothetical protein